jgi:hypothetical protein
MAHLIGCIIDVAGITVSVNSMTKIRRIMKIIINSLRVLAVLVLGYTLLPTGACVAVGFKNWNGTTSVMHLNIGICILLFIACLMGIAVAFSKRKALGFLASGGISLLGVLWVLVSFLPNMPTLMGMRLGLIYGGIAIIGASLLFGVHYLSGHYNEKAAAG